MSAQQVEAFLARLYGDSQFRAKFMDEPGLVFSDFDLEEAEKQSLRALDRTGLQFAAASYQRKRENRANKHKNH